MLSIRRFLILVSLAVITLVNFIAALHGYRTGLENSDRLIDKKLMEKTELVADLAVSANDGIIVSASPENLLFQQFDAHGALIRRSSQAPVTPLSETEGFASFNHDGFRWHSYLLVENETGMKTLVAERMDNRYAVAEEIILKTIIPILLGLPFLSLLIWFIVTQGLRPLNRLSDEVASKKSQDLTPIQQQDLPQELQPLLDSMNGLLLRLSDSFEREKRFSGDAAHELRTPLSALKINLFNLKKQLPEGDGDVEAMEESLSRMVHLIEQMLLLYRMSPEQFQSGFTEVNLLEVCQQVIANNYAAIDDKQQEIVLEGEALMLEGDAFALTTLVKNLVDNANKYTPEHGDIRVAIEDASQCVLLIVEDSGEGIPDELMARALERFYRVHGDRHPSKIQGCGLGLSIVKHIVELHHGQISLHRSAFASGLKVEVRLPKTQEGIDENTVA